MSFRISGLVVRTDQPTSDKIARLICPRPYPKTKPKREKIFSEREETKEENGLEEPRREEAFTRTCKERVRLDVA